MHPSLDQSERLRVMQALMGLLLIVIIQGGLSRAKIELPQKSGQSLMTMISDDTRTVISSTLMTKVESYFHGGIKVDNCAMEDETNHILHEGEEHEHEHGAECNHPKKRFSGFNPISWINSHIHAQEHRHLTRSRSVELLPWIVSASRASPHNIDSYQIGSYVLNKMVDKPQVAIDFLQEGIKNNPENFELEVSLAEIYLSTLKDRASAAAGFERALTKCLALQRELTDDESFLKLKICFYLGVIAKDNGDSKRLREVYQLALKENPQNTVTHSLAQWLTETENLNRK